MTEILNKVNELFLELPSEEEMWKEYDNYVYNNTTGIKWLKWQTYKLFGIRPDKNIHNAIFKVRFDTLKNQL